MTAATETQTLTEFTLELECESRVCRETASHALVFHINCNCVDRFHTWFLCSAHVDRGLQELRERFEWSCKECGLIGFWCIPIRIEAL